MAPVLRYLAAVVLQDSAGHMLFWRRPETGLLAGQWEFPCVPVQKLAAQHGSGLAETSAISEPPGEVIDDLQLLLKSKLVPLLPEQLPLLKDSKVPPVEHAFSHEHHTTYLYQAFIGQDMSTIAASSKEGA